jgi:hypothetical protein
VSNVRRRKAKVRRYEHVNVTVPGARKYLIEQEREYGVDYRLDPPALVRTPTLDALEHDETVEVDAWELPGDTDWTAATFGGLYAVVRVGPEDTVTLIAHVDGPLDLPRDERGRALPSAKPTGP